MPNSLKAFITGIRNKWQQDNPSRQLSSNQKIALMDMEVHMWRVHGHSDRAAMESDLKDGVPVNDLLSRNCSLCGKPRNQRGDSL